MKNFFLIFVIIVSAGNFASGARPIEKTIDVDLLALSSNYSSKNWGKFFVQTIMFRKKIENPVAREQVSSGILDNVISLEILALIKHCQWEIIDRLKGEILTKYSDKNLPTFEKTLDILELRKEYKTFQEDQKNKKAKISEAFKSLRDYKKINLKKISSLPPNRHVEIKLRSKCQK